jgi:predicted O-methyltransferase YrrM
MTARPDIRAVLGLEDAFADYRFDESRVDLQGWNSTHEFFHQLIGLVRPSLIIELGVWKGKSSIHMATAMKSLGVEGQIIAVDTWLGSSNHLSTEGRRAELRPKAGYPTVYETFMANVSKSGHSDVIVPLPMDGGSAAVALNRLGVKAQLIHIDASHEYLPCLADLRAYWPLLADDGILLADDYGTWPSVSRAVCTFAAEVDRPLFASMTKAIIPKSENQGFVMRFGKAQSYKRTMENQS